MWMGDLGVCDPLALVAVLVGEDVRTPPVHLAVHPFPFIHTAVRVEILASTPAMPQLASRTSQMQAPHARPKVDRASRREQIARVPSTQGNSSGAGGRENEKAVGWEGGRMGGWEDGRAGGWEGGSTLPHPCILPGVRALHTHTEGTSARTRPAPNAGIKGPTCVPQAFILLHHLPLRRRVNHDALSAVRHAARAVSRARPAAPDHTAPARVACRPSIRLHTDHRSHTCKCPDPATPHRI